MTRIFLSLLCLVLAAPLAAQQANDGSARLRLQVNQLTAEVGRLNRENGELQQELDALRSQLESAQGDLERTAGRLNRAENSAAQFRQATQRGSEQLDVMRARERDLVARFRETITQLRGTEQARATLKNEVANLETAYASCADNNRQMFSTAEEILATLEGRGGGRRLIEGEPFTQIARVRLENLVDEYRYDLEDQLVPETDR